MATLKGNAGTQTVNIEAVLATIRQMESGGNYTVVTSGGSDACGAYQYITSTWQVMLNRTITAGYLPQGTIRYNRACEAPPKVQDAVARYDVTSFLGSVGDDVSKVPLHWYYPASIATWPAMANYIPPGNSISLGDYQRKWLQTYSVFAKVPLSSLNEGDQGNQMGNNAAPVYSYGQLEQIWISAGGNPQVANIAAAVATAESGGDPNAVSASNDYGLWQINRIHGAQASLDVMTNAKAAVAISNNGKDWGAWCTCWVNPNQNCGHHLGPMPQPGSPAAKQIRTGVAPDPNTPLNATGAATQTPNPYPSGNPPDTATETAWFTGCNTLEWALAPGPCAAGSAAKKVAGEPAHLAGQVIDLIIGSILNPIISIVAGIMGMAAGGALMLIALFMLVKDSTAAQAIKGIVETAAVSAVAPELAPEVGAAEAAKVHDVRQAKKAGKEAVGRKVGTQRQAHSKRFQEAQRREALRNQSKRYKMKPGESFA